jgi:hypothetical protein
MKSELLTFPKGSKIAFETHKIHASNDGNNGGGNWGYNVTDSTNTKPTAVIL